jgi:DNA-binding Xre family transcriptional regulator
MASPGNTMSQSKQLVDTLKQELRKQRVNYRQVAEALDLSEASVKRLFAERSFTIYRLEKVCELLNFGFNDLVQQMEKNVDLTTGLTVEQEKELASNDKLLMMGHFLVNRFEFYEIIRNYEISETEGIQLLAKLDRMKIIELQPGNRVKLLIAPNFKWRPNGPLQRYFEEKVQTEFFNSPFEGPGEIRIFSSGSLSKDANAEVLSKIKHLVKELNGLIKDSEALPGDQRVVTSMVIALRPWEVKVFRDLRRSQNGKVL